MKKQEKYRLLVLSDLSESNGTWSELMGFLDPSAQWGTLTGCLGGQLLAGSLGSSGFTGCLLGSGHFLEGKKEVIG